MFERQQLLAYSFLTGPYPCNIAYISLGEFASYCISAHNMNEKRRIFISSVQKELELERAAVAGLISTDRPAKS
jgi:hypothetical protein